jgi:predicted dehydrogenase
MGKIKLGLIGCGKQAEKHINSIKKLDVAGVYVADIKTELAQALAEKSGASWLENPNDIFSDQDIRAVLVCTPTPSHKGIILNVLEAGKDVFCEKPLCNDLNEALELKEAEDRAGKSALVGYIYRYVPIFEEGFRLMNDFRTNGESLLLGKPLSAYFRLGGRGSHQVWKHRSDQGGGAINEMLVHMIDLANWYFGPFKDVEVLSNTIKCKERQIQGRMESVDAEDFVMVRLYNGMGVEILCQADLITPAFTQYAEIQCENGTFMGSIQQEMPSFIFMKHGRGGYDTGRTNLKFGQRNVLDIQMAYFVQKMLKGQKPDRNRIGDSVDLMKIIEEIRSQRRRPL